MLMPTQKYYSPSNDSALQFQALISKLEIKFRDDNKPIRHQLLCRSVRVALGMKVDSKSYPNEFPFYVSIKGSIHFINKWKKAIHDLGKLQYSFNYLASVLARTLYYKDFAELLLTFELYEKLKEDKWIFNNQKVMKPDHFYPKTFIKSRQIYFDPKTFIERRQISFVMPGILEYGSSSQAFSVGDTYSISTLKGDIDRYCAHSARARGISRSVRRTWGDSPVDAVIWLVANTVVEYGTQAWNRHVKATDVKLDMFEAREKYYQADSCIQRWNDSKQLKELKRQALAHYCQ